MTWFVVPCGAKRFVALCLARAPYPDPSVVEEVERLGPGGPLGHPSRVFSSSAASSQAALSGGPVAALSSLLAGERCCCGCCCGCWASAAPSCEVSGCCASGAFLGVLGAASPALSVSASSFLGALCSGGSCAVVCFAQEATSLAASSGVPAMPRSSGASLLRVRAALSAVRAHCDGCCDLVCYEHDASLGALVFDVC